MGTVSNDNLIGFSNLQKDEIDSAFGELNTINYNITSVNNFFSLSKTDLENADTDINDGINSLDSKFNDAFISLTDVDNSIYSLIRYDELSMNAVIVSLTAVDNSLSSVINANHLFMEAEIDSLNEVDASLFSVFNAAKAEIELNIISLATIDTTFSNTINANIISINNDITSLTAADTSILNKINVANGSFNNDIAGLQTADAALVLSDAQINASIVSLTGTYNQYVTENNTRQTEIETDITNNYTEFTTAKLSLITVDSVFNSSLDSAVLSIDYVVNSLQDIDDALLIAINSNHSLFLYTTSQFNEVDAGLQASLDDNVDSINTELTDLHEKNLSLISLVDHNYSIFEETRIDLFTFDTQLSIQLASVISNLDYNVASLNAVDDSLTELIESNYSIFSDARNLLEAEDTDLQNQLDSMTSIFDADIVSLTAFNTSQNNTITALETDITGITNDISGRVQAEINAKVSNAIFEELKTDLEAEDSEIRAILATKVNAALQADLDDGQNDAIDTKVDLTVYNAKVEELTAMNHTWEERFRAAEEFIRVMLATYTITNPNTNNIFSFSGALQNINPGTPLMTLDLVETANNNSWGLDLRLSEYGYNTFTGSIVAVIGGGVAYTLTKSNFDSTNRKNILTLSSSRSGNAAWNTSGVALPVDLIYKSYSGMNIFTITLNSTLFTTLTTPVRVVRKVASSSTAWGLVLKMSDYEYNNFTGSIVADVGGVTYTLAKSDFSAATREYTLVVPNSRDGSNWSASVTLPFNILYKDTGNNVISTISFSSSLFSSLSTA
jgi:hypothetical protein